MRRFCNGSDQLPYNTNSPRSPKKRRGQCSVCNRYIQVRLDGMAAKHETKEFSMRLQDLQAQTSVIDAEI